MNTRSIKDEKLKRSPFPGDEALYLIPEIIGIRLVQL
jgi:hypothetical protein